SSFLMVAIAELGDKTQILTIILSSKYRSISVFFGSFFGLILVDGLSILMGNIISTLIPIYLINLVSGISFITLGVYTLFSKKTENEIKDLKFSMTTSFVLVAMMELGDKTQITALILAIKYNVLLFIFLGMILAYIFIVGLGVFIGKKLLKFIPQHYLRIFSSLLFLTFGILYLINFFTLTNPLIPSTVT
ncbi:MAG: TMEM165/GDT1 family protein, partial [Candidatus Bathyarchaeia archaeon]